jgi:hypothetical protein
VSGAAGRSAEVLRARGRVDVEVGTACHVWQSHIYIRMREVRALGNGHDEFFDHTGNNPFESHVRSGVVSKRDWNALLVTRFDATCRCVWRGERGMCANNFAKEIYSPRKLYNAPGIPQLFLQATLGLSCKPSVLLMMNTDGP